MAYRKSNRHKAGDRNKGVARRSMAEYPYIRQLQS